MLNQGPCEIALRERWRNEAGNCSDGKSFIESLVLSRYIETQLITTKVEVVWYHMGTYVAFWFLALVFTWHSVHSGTLQQNSFQERYLSPSSRRTYGATLTGFEQVHGFV